MIEMKRGQMWGEWIVLSTFYDQERQSVYCEVQCGCGEKSAVSSFNLRSGRSKQCRKCGYTKRIAPKYDREKWIDQKVMQKMRDYKTSAKNRGYVFELELKRFKELILSPCFYCQIEWSNVVPGSKNRPDFHYNGIDRTDNNQGYTFGNAVPCCRDCNIAKKAMGYGQFSDWIARLADNHKNWGV